MRFAVVAGSHAAPEMRPPARRSSPTPMHAHWQPRVRFRLRACGAANENRAATSASRDARRSSGKANGRPSRSSRRTAESGRGRFRRRSVDRRGGDPAARSARARACGRYSASDSLVRRWRRAFRQYSLAISVQRRRLSAPAAAKRALRMPIRWSLQVDQCPSSSDPTPPLGIDLSSRTRADRRHARPRTKCEH